MAYICKFTSASAFIAAPPGYDEPWLTVGAFSWDLVYRKPELGQIIVKAGFPFDGASIPPVPGLRLIFPRVHPDYMQSAALHDWCLKNERHRFSRQQIDKIFQEALVAQGNPEWRVRFMYLGVRSWGMANERAKYFQKLVPDPSEIS